MGLRQRKGIGTIMSDGDIGDLSKRKVWAEKYPNEDTYGSIIIGWLLLHPSCFETDWRLANVTELELSAGWKAFLQFTARVWAKTHNLSPTTIKRSIQESKLKADVKMHLLGIFDWAVEAGDYTAVQDYEQAIGKVWQTTRRKVTMAGMAEATKQISEDGQLDAGIVNAMQVIEQARNMAGTGGTGVNSMAELASDVEKLYGAPRGKPMSTGFVRIDKATFGGIRKGQEWLLGGAAKQGKSTFAREITYRFIQDQGRAFVASMEMSKDEMRTCFIARHAHTIKKGGIALRDIFQETLTADDKEVYFEAARQWAKPGGIGDNIELWTPETDVTADDVIRRAEIEHSRKPIDLLVVDYSELLVPIRRRAEYRIELGDSIRRLKTAAQHFANGEGVAVLLLHQVSRKGFTKACKRGHYIMSDLGETSAAEKHPNVVIWILQTSTWEDDKEAKIGIAANRMGPRDLKKGVMVMEDFEHGLVSDLEFPQYH